MKFYNTNPAFPLTTEEIYKAFHENAVMQKSYKRTVDLPSSSKSYCT
jgi:hypothetical protein